jgi:glycosyltransferase involved in cell wall biosynthesis
MRPKVLFLTHELAPGSGGGGTVASWMLEALVSAYEVTLLCWKPPDLAALDRIYGTALEGLRFATLTPSLTERLLIDRIPDSDNHQRANYLLRMAKRRRHAFDVLVACGFESDFGCPGIQYLHYPYLERRAEEWPTRGDEPLPVRLGHLLAGRVPPWMAISGYSFDRMRRNLTLVNSSWTVGQTISMASEVLYPPAPGTFPDVPWTERRDAFACIGRLIRLKRFDWIVETLALVRREWPDLELHICGVVSDASYLSRLEELARRHGPWVHIHTGLARNELAALLSNCRYGIHACLNEHFGIAPAEMARAGAIPFVHSSGGQVEIVDRDPHLCYTTAEDAAAKILAVLRDAGLQRALRATVYRRSERFTTDAFVRGFLGYMARFISTQHGAAG